MVYLHVFKSISQCCVFSEPDCCDNPESARCKNSVLGDANIFNEDEIIKTSKKDNKLSTSKVKNKKNSKFFISSLNVCILST